MARLLSVIFVFVVSVCVAAWQLHLNHDVWTADGAIYLRMTMQHRGTDSESARTATSQFVLNELDKASVSNPTSGNAGDRALYAPTPPQYYTDQFELFRNRPLYPIVAATLYPRFGPFALKIVSAVAYVATVMAVLAILLSMTSTFKALIGALPSTKSLLVWTDISRHFSPDAPVSLPHLTAKSAGVWVG